MSKLPEESGQVANEATDAVFAEPWEARAFALALMLSHAGRFEWKEFSANLIAEIAAADASASGASYYEAWLIALERSICDKGILAPAEIDERAAAIAASPPARTKARSSGPINIA
jgi:nitrile hydratase accessory protein